MTIHHGGKVGKAGKLLSSKSTSKQTKTKASKVLNNHKKRMH